MSGHGHVTPRPDGVKARCGGPGLCAECNQEAATAGFREAAGGPATVNCPQCGHVFAPAATREPVRVTESAPTTEAVISGERTFDEIRDLVRDAISARMKLATGASYCWVYVNDLTLSEVVYASNGDDLYQCSYSIAADGAVTLGAPMEVVRTYAPAGDTSGEPPEADDGLELGGLMESKGAKRAGETVRDLAGGRVLEAKGSDENGGRIFRMRIIAYGDSKNRRRYTESVMRAAVPLYEGARAYDHHRTTEELTTGSLTGLCGSFRGVEAETDGLYGDLHLLPSATHVAETLDATLEAQDQGLPALVGVSHDVQAHFQSVVEGGLQIQEATQIVGVQSVDVVSTPAAGGKAVRAVAGGEETIEETDPAADGADGESTRESDVTVKTTDVLAALQTATPEQLAAVGLSKVEPAKESTPPVAQSATEAAEPAQPKTSWLARTMIRQKVEDAKLPVAVVESLTESLPERITESDVDAQIASLKSVSAMFERSGLAPTVTTQVTQESLDKKTAALDAFFAGDHAKGYRSFKEAYVDFTGRHPRAFDEDFNRAILRECFGGGFDSSMRSTESLDSTSWAQVLGDSVARRMVAAYQAPALQDWRRVVSAAPPINDFRTQRITRVGGYGLTPTVAEGAPYQPLTSPGDEEATYAIIKRGGTDDLTLEMIANDDVRAIVGLPGLMGRAAAITLYRFVFDIFTANAATTYDSVALFHASHNNTTTGALNHTNLTAARAAMAAQVAYGSSIDVLSLTPQLLIVPPALEDIAFQLTRSAVAIPSTTPGATNVPNLHQSMNGFVRVDYYTDANDWFALADPAACPTIEVGFYQGREAPELFTQADPSVGSMFNADKMTLKLRHIYGSAVLDHRGMYRSTN